jgi:hypothetical protein
VGHAGPRRDSGPDTPPSPLGAWQRLPPLPVEVEGAAVASYKGKLWVVGGLSADEPRLKLDTVFTFDPGDRTWTRGPSLPFPVSHAVLVSGFGLYLIGGWIDTGGSKRVLKYNDADKVWVDDIALPEARVSGAAAFDGGKILFAGGTRPDNSAADDIWAFQNGKWLEIGKLARGRQKLAAISNGAGIVTFYAAATSRPARPFGDIDVVSDNILVVSSDGKRPTVDPPMEAAVGVRINGVGNCLIGGQLHSGGFADWWCNDQSVINRLPKLNPQRSGMGAAVIGKTVYVVGGYGTTFVGSNLVEAFTPNV